MKQKGEVEDSATLITLSELPDFNYGSMEMGGVSMCVCVCLRKLGSRKEIEALLPCFVTAL